MRLAHMLLFLARPASLPVHPPSNLATLSAAQANCGLDISDHFCVQGRPTLLCLQAA
jgi:hypothetical protein